MDSPATLVHACICHLNIRASQANHHHQHFTTRSAWTVCRALNLPAGPLIQLPEPCRQPTDPNVAQQRHQASPIANSSGMNSKFYDDAVIDAALRLWLDDLRRHLNMIDCKVCMYAHSACNHSRRYWRETCVALQDDSRTRCCRESMQPAVR